MLPLFFPDENLSLSVKSDGEYLFRILLGAQREEHGLWGLRHKLKTADLEAALSSPVARGELG